MDAGAARPLSVQVSAPAPRAPQETAPVAQTELPEAATVTPTRETSHQTAAQDQSREETRDKTLDEANADRQLKRESFRDDVTDTLVFREIDEASGEVIRQLPEESILRLRRALADNAQMIDASEKASVNRTL